MKTFALINDENIVKHLIGDDNSDNFNSLADFTAIEVPENILINTGMVYDKKTKTFAWPEHDKTLIAELNFMSLFDPTELGAIYTNATTNVQTAIMLDKLRSNQMTFSSNDVEIKTWLDALVSANVLKVNPVV